MAGKPIIATATSTVSNGKSSTSTLNYSQGYSRSNLIPGNTYQINGAYQENNHYSYAEGIGTLEMLKCNTTTTLSGNSQIPVGESLTITAIVKENDGNTSLSRGSLKLYDGNSLVQTIPVTNTTTSISYTSNVAGTHDLYVIYEDSGIEYNTSTSNHLNVTVTKLEMIFDIQEITNTNDDVTNDEGMIVGKIDEIIEIHGYLTYANDNGLHGSVGALSFNVYDYNGSLIDTISTNTNGSFLFGYEIPSELANEQVITLNYEGNNILESALLEIPIIVNPSIIQISDIAYEMVNGVTYDSNSEERPVARWNEEDGDLYIYVTVYDENGDEVQSGELEWYYSIPEEGYSQQTGITTSLGGIYFPIYDIYENYPDVSEIYIYPVWVDATEEGIYEDSRENPESDYIRVHRKYIYDSTEPEDWINTGYYEQPQYNEYDTWSVE
ncbi:Ig-like domain-containing protein [Methanosphaera sp.]|uniref:Ig-like domain-containing protein n=1 Tax=Methanosphaera sp. TaxID=2666342 RepID=UPI0025CF986D|nr:Ig-like domain-containing protein [Methanosphaera sp.]